MKTIWIVYMMKKMNSFKIVEIIYIEIREEKMNNIARMLSDSKKGITRKYTQKETKENLMLDPTYRNQCIQYYTDDDFMTKHNSTIVDATLDFEKELYDRLQIKLTQPKDNEKKSLYGIVKRHSELYLESRDYVYKNKHYFGL